MAVASDVGLGAGESAAEAAIINMAMATKKSFIFNASIVSECITFFVWEEKRERFRGSSSSGCWKGGAGVRCFI